MIRTYAYKDIKIGEIFAREEEKTNVADVFWPSGLWQRDA